MKVLAAAALAISCMTPSFSYALNDREQGILIGAVISGLIRSHADNHRDRDIEREREIERREMRRERSRYPQPVVIYPYPPVVNVPAPRQRLCLNHPYYDHHGRIIGYTYSCH